MVAIDTVRDTTREPICGVLGVSRGFARGVEVRRSSADVDLLLRSGEIVILFPFGLRQVQLLRIIAGLIKPSGGAVVYRARHPVSGPAEGVAMDGVPDLSPSSCC
jgi:ABC-type taurine transport system ATPase subunit